MRALRLKQILLMGLGIPAGLGVLYGLGVLFEFAGGETWNVGFYGKFNRARSVIERMSDVQIIDSWQHHDIHLEDFGFTVRSKTGQTAQVDFLELSPQKKMDDPAEIKAYVHACLQKQP